MFQTTDGVAAVFGADVFEPHNRNKCPHNSQATAFCNAWPILLFVLQAVVIPLLMLYYIPLVLLLQLSTSVLHIVGIQSNQTCTLMVEYNKLAWQTKKNVRHFASTTERASGSIGTKMSWGGSIEATCKSNCLCHIYLMPDHIIPKLSR